MNGTALQLDFNWTAETPVALTEDDIRARQVREYIIQHLHESGGHALTLRTVKDHFQWAWWDVRAACKLLMVDSDTHGEAIIEEPGPHTGRMHLTKVGQQAAIEAKVLKV